MHPSFSASASWSQGWTVHRSTVALPLSPDLGSWLIEQRLFAHGGDFTSPGSNSPGYQGTSTLKALWEKGNEEPLGASTAHLWVLAHHGQASGVVVWLQKQAAEGGFFQVDVPEPMAQAHHRSKRALSAVHLGCLMAYLKPEHRRQGLVRRVMASAVAPEVLAQARQARLGGHLPFIAATDATVPLWESVSHVPVVPHFDLCQASRRAIWDYHRHARFYPEKRFAFSEFLVEPQPLAPPRRARPR